MMFSLALLASYAAATCVGPCIDATDCAGGAGHFTDDMSTDKSNWVAGSFDTAFTIASGVLTVAPPASNSTDPTLWLAGSELVGDATIQVDVSTRDLTTVGQNNLGGIVLYGATRSLDRHSMASGYTVEISQNFTSSLSQATFDLKSWASGVPTVLASADLSYDTSVPHTWKVVVAGSAMNFYLDAASSPLLSYSASVASRAGFVGLWAGNAYSDNDFSFDNFDLAATYMGTCSVATCTAPSIAPNDDADYFGNSCDNCPFHYNLAQTDSDADGAGDACDILGDTVAASTSLATTVSVLPALGAASLGQFVIPKTNDTCSVAYAPYSWNASQPIPSGIVFKSAFLSIGNGCDAKLNGQAIQIKFANPSSRKRTPVVCVAEYNAVLNQFYCLPSCGDGSDFSCADGSGIYVLMEAAAITCPALAPLSEPDRPAIIEASFENVNQLTVRIKSKRYDTRHDAPIIAIGTGSCVPKAPGWVLTAGSAGACWNEYVATFEWAVLSSGDCGLVATNDTLLQTFTGKFTVTETDNYMARSTVVNRTTQTDLGVTITLPMTQELTTVSTRVFAPINNISVVTSSSFNRTSSELIMFIRTSVQYPFDLTLQPGTASYSGSGITMNTPNTSSSSGCANQVSPIECVSTTEFVLDTSACVINGSLSFTMALSCSSDISPDCPLNGGETVTVLVLFPSINLCGDVTVEVPDDSLTMNIGTYKSGAYNVTKSGFLYDQTIYVRSTVSSNAVQLIAGSLLSAFAKTDTGASVNLTALPSFHASSVVANDGTVTSDFYFVVTYANFPVPTDQNGGLTITIKLGVEYLNSAKRDIIYLVRQVGGATTKDGAIAVDLVNFGTAANPDEPASAAVSLAPAAATLLAIVVAALFI